jgi:hypothetical protein
MQFKKATKEQSKLRLALFGPSGSGKTFTALRLATGITGKIAVIDTERGSASKYANRFEFDVLELGKATRAIEHYAQAIKAANDNGYDILVIDSLSHAWFELLDEVEKIARAKYRGNTWSAWSEGTPKQRELVDAILDYDGHIIATMRVKTEWATEQTSRGKSRPVRVGLAPQQGKGIEYEFDLLGELSHDHILVISKDRTGRFQDRVIEAPGEDMGRELAEWLQDGLPPRPRPQSDEPFKDADAAIKWGLEQDVFNHEKHARNSYTKLKEEKEPKNAREMARLWREKVANKATDKALSRGENPDPAIDDDGINRILSGDNEVEEL